MAVPWTVAMAELVRLAEAGGKIIRMETFITRLLRPASDKAGIHGPMLKG